MSIELLSDHTYYIDGQLQGRVGYLIEGEVFEYSIKSTPKETVVLMKSENQKEWTEVAYNKKEQLIKADGKIIAEVNETSKESPTAVRNASWSDTPFYGTPSSYNILVSTSDGNVRFSEAILTAVQSGVFGYASGLIIAALISAVGVALIVGAVASAIFAGLTYNPQDAAYFTKWKYDHPIRGYHQHIASFYYDPSHRVHWATNTVYSTDW
jgi:hypothetical protein